MSKQVAKPEKMFAYPSQEDLMLLQHQVRKEENHRSRVVYNFLRGIDDRDEKKWWTMLVFPMLRDKEKERLFKP